MARQRGKYKVKRCGTCKEMVSLLLFGKCKRSVDGLNYRCKPCDREWTAKWREANREAHRKTAREYVRDNPEKLAAYNYIWTRANRDKKAASSNKRRATKLKATPSWIDDKEVAYIYSLAQERGLVVDHIVPLTSKYVCGLHVQANLRCIPAKLNLHKSNRYWPDMAGG